MGSNITFAIKGLTLADGRVVGANGPDGDPPGAGQDGAGAGILSQDANVILTGCQLTNNFAQGGNAGQDPNNVDGGKGGDALGGAIHAIGGSLNITNCVLTFNQAVGGMGFAPAANWNTGPSGQAMGGAIFWQGAGLHLHGVVLSNNTGAGGIPYGQPASLGASGSSFGGALYVTNCIATISSSLMQSNTAHGGEPTTGGFAGAAAGSGGGTAGGIFFSEDCSGKINLSSFLNNSAIGGRGTRSYPAGSGMGGDIFNEGELQVSESSFSNSRSVGGEAGGVAHGAAVCSTGRLTVGACAFVNCFAEAGNKQFSLAREPGAEAEGEAVWSSGTLSCTNSTITACRLLGGRVYNSFGDAPGGPAAGGGLYLINNTAVLVNLTVAANRADSTNAGPALGGNLATTNANVTILNSIIADSGNGGDVWGVVTDGGHNICSDGTANFSAPGSLNQADPLLSALSNNGGPTPTMALLVGSPARDAIVSGFPITDQRGVARPQGPAADIGAFEADFVSGTAPAIVTQPIAQAVRAGTNVTFTVGASGTQPLYYQWREDGNPIAGATSSVLSLLNVQANNAGTYSVIVTNSFGYATSQGASLAIDSAPIILMQPVSIVVPPGAATNFSVVADGPSLAYQWWHDSAPVSGGTAATLNIPSALAGSQGSYFAVVSNSTSVVTSGVATLSFDASALNILVPPKDATVEAGYPASFSVLVSGIPPFAYQWEHNGVAIPGATSSSYVISAVTTNFAGTYDVVVTNGYRGITSQAALLTVTAGATPPLLVPARFGQSLTMTFNAEAGRSYRLLSSTNFTIWSPVATNTAFSAGPLQFVQSINPGAPLFYRVVTP